MSKLRRVSRELTGRLERHRWIASVSALTLVAAMAVGLFSASKAEENDAFCITCHIAPEQTYYDRAQSVRALQANSVVNLAGAHVGERGSFACIDCHRGDQGLTDRGRTLALGARDALIFISARADPSLEKGAASAPDLLNRACRQCHTKSLVGGGFNNHFHNLLAEARRIQETAGTPAPVTAGVASTVTCTSCHRAHVQIEGGPDRHFLDTSGVVYPACVQCHRELGQGPLSLGQ